MDYKTLSSQYLHREPWLTVRKDAVEVPNGHVIPEYYVLEYPDWVNAIGITKDGKMVMIRQHRYGLGRTAYELCAGVIEEGEDILESAKREMLEETGYGNGEWKKIMTISPNPATQTNLVHCYLATGIEKLADQKLEKSEDITVHLFEQDEVKRMLANDEIIQALHAAPLLKYFTMEAGII
ncbi:MAG: NUDIX hydrolase [Sphingobacteriales bacterium]|nr:MAG: NUDIX hydrolase [Sphingobacteriales bacterium]